jgi:RNA polymerase sigma factor (sigma-70 family)
VLELPRRQRAAVYLFYWEGETIEGAAQLMGCSPGTVSRYLHIARRRLKGRL